MNDSELISQLEKAGLHFRPGLTEDELQKIEKIYAVRLPDDFRKHYSIAVPTADDRFPDWTDFSPENVEAVRVRMRAPYEMLAKDVENGYWVPSWGEKPADKAEREARLTEILAGAPVLLPLYGHRYLPAAEGIGDLPVLSTVGRDTVPYGDSLAEWMKVEFLSCPLSESVEKAKTVPLWGDLIAFNEAEWKAKEEIRKELGLYDRMTNLEFENLIVSDIISQYPEYADCLEKQYRSAKVTKRENTGRGFFTEYEITDRSCRIDGSPDLTLGKRQWNLNGLKYGSDYILWVKEGLITCLEGFCYGEEQWPDEIINAEII